MKVNKVLFKNLLHVVEAAVVGGLLMYFIGIGGYVAGAAIILVMWLISYMAIITFQTPVVSKTVKNKVGVTVTSTKRQWLIGLITWLLGYAVGSVMYMIH